MREDKLLCWPEWHPGIMKLIIAIVILMIVILAFRFEGFGALCGVLFALFLAGLMLYSAASVIYEVIWG